METILAIITTNWAFIAVAFILGLIGEVIKSIVINGNKEKALTVKWKFVFIKTLPIHPIVAGALLGLLLFTTVPSFVVTTGLGGSVLYFAAAGALSTWVYSMLKSLAPKITKALQKKLTTTIGKRSDNKLSSSEDEPDES